ncbi:hypothetical protein ACFV0R_34210 [Streptomyces sp. NPDC059578]|uniref:hypothetical protein n=1 Tax=Streptomyces sp. NPDC059578 TaxID=3346874 RepID=UPI00368CC1AD
MRRMMVTTAAMAAVVCGAGPVPAAVGAPAAARFHQCGYEVENGPLHLRSGPGTRYASLGLLRENDWLHADRARGRWWHVELSAASRGGLPVSADGWVARRHLRKAICMNY